MLTKFMIAVFLIAILAALFSGLAFLVKDPSTSENRRTVKALTWRVALQLALVVFLVVAYFMGWLTPHGLGR